MVMRKISELDGAALDEAVERCEPTRSMSTTDGGKTWKPFPAPRYSRDWAAAGRIIERERISVYFQEYGDVYGRWREEPMWIAGTKFELESSPVYDSGGGYPSVAFEHSAAGPTPLIAAMRAYVASKFGEEIDLP